jgi:hypothetical protein
MKVLLIERRKHERAGCTVSTHGLFDHRCRVCREFDELLAFTNRLGWAPTPYDKTLLKSLRISPR